MTLGAAARSPLGSSLFLPVLAPAVTMASQLFVTPRLSFLTTGPHLSVESNDRADRSLICAVTFCFITISIQACGGLSRGAVMPLRTPCLLRVLTLRLTFLAAFLERGKNTKLGLCCCSTTRSSGGLRTSKVPLSCGDVPPQAPPQPWHCGDFSTTAIWL